MISAARWNEIRETKRHTGEAVEAFLRDECCIVAIIGCDWDIPMPTVAIEGCEYIGIPLRIDEVIHTWYYICIADCGHVQTSVVNTETYRTIFLERE